MTCNVRVSGQIDFCCWQRESAAAQLYSSDTEIVGSSHWLTGSGAVAAPAGNVLTAHTRIIHMLPAVLFSRYICNVLRCQLVVMLYFKFMYAVLCGILRYLSFIASS